MLCNARRRPFRLLRILQLARFTSWTLSAAVQQPFITDFNSHTHEISKQSYRPIDIRDRFPTSRTTGSFNRNSFIFDPDIRESIYEVIYLNSDADGGEG